MTAAELHQELGKVNFVSLLLMLRAAKSRDAGEWGYCRLPRPLKPTIKQHCSA